MKHINDSSIHQLLHKALNPDSGAFRAALEKSKNLQRLSLEEAARLLSAQTPDERAMLFAAAAEVKNKIYGRRVVLFAPLYISNYCVNRCRYCAFQAGNTAVVRKALNVEEIRQQVRYLLSRGHKRALIVAGEAPPDGMSLVDYYTRAIDAVYDVSVGPHRIRRANINCAPLSAEEFRRIKAAGIGTYQLFQETYHDETYRWVHPGGPKSDPDNRLDAIDRAFAAGIDDVGIGVLYGLYDYRFETLALLSHIEYLEHTYRVGPHTISVPRIEPATGCSFTHELPYRLGDDDFKKVVAVLRLAVPYTGLILTTRERAELRDELVTLGISQISAESKTAPGGYDHDVQTDAANGQFHTSDHRTLDEIIGSLIDRKLIPSFCAACYRLERTGEAFMELAKPGAIQGMCNINALITLKEYLDDFASPRVRDAGYALIAELRGSLDAHSTRTVERAFAQINTGTRDHYV